MLMQARKGKCAGQSTQAWNGEAGCRREDGYLVGHYSCKVGDVEGVDVTKVENCVKRR